MENKTLKADQKLNISFEVKKGNNIYTFLMPYQCPLGEAYDAIYEVLSDVVDMSKRAYEQAKREEKKEESTDDASSKQVE